MIIVGTVAIGASAEVLPKFPSKLVLILDSKELTDNLLISALAYWTATTPVLTFDIGEVLVLLIGYLDTTDDTVVF